MSKFIINHSVNGYQNTDIKNNDIYNRDNTVILVLDESTSNKLVEYYDACTKMLSAGTKLCIIMVGKDSKIRKSICNLAANYRNYNLYKVDSKETVTEEYANTIIEREPTIDEVQSFIGGDISGFSDINIILTGIDDLVNHGDIDGLKTFIESHIHSIDNLTTVIDYMKKIVDSNSSNELMDRISSLQSELSNITDKFKETEAENNRIKDENLKLIGDKESAKQTLAKVMSEKQSLEQQLSSNTPVIQTYTEINTSSLHCKTKNILYFKEISYVRYMNSFVVNLMNVMKLTKHTVKMLIYDGNVGINTYNPLNIVSGSEFVTNKRNFIAKAETFVVVEPNRAILTSILESVNPVFDIVIIYDRMHRLENIVDGNFVTKYYVINSNKDFNEVKDKFRITDRSRVITRPNCNIGPEALNIPEIPGYNGPKVTESARLSKYKRLQSEGSNKILFDTIMDCARIERR